MMKNSDTLRITLLQSHIVWEDRDANLAHYDELLRPLSGKTDLAILPELFTTGMSMRVRELAEPMDGKTVTTAKNWAKDYGIAIAGSFIAAEDGVCYNRAFFVLPTGDLSYYDKRHLFQMAGENESFGAGKKRLIVDYLGWKICLMVCYDLRFPVWSRNLHNEYDLLIYVANWAASRKKVWASLLQARSIENMSYVAGVNRTGLDGREFSFHGGSLVFSPRGEIIADAGEKEENMVTCELKRDELDSFRRKFPAWQDADEFEIK